MSARDPSLKRGTRSFSMSCCQGWMALKCIKKVNTNTMAEISWSSPKGKFCGAGKEISEALGRKPLSTDFKERHPFDVEILRVSPGKTAYPYHSHSAQWEFYHVVSGRGLVRH